MSWICTIKATGEVFETFSRRMVALLDRDKVLVETALQYLGRINAEIAEAKQ